MKVLLLQEMSGVHTELKKGLLKIGIHAEIATLGQHFRKYKSDIYLGNDKNDKINSLKRACNQLIRLPKLKSFDVIQTISPNPFHKAIGDFMEEMLYTSDVKNIYIAAGSDEIYLKHVQELEYWPQHASYGSEGNYEKFRNKLHQFSSIVPVCWEYKYAMEQAGLKTTEVIPFPIDVQAQKYIPFKKDKKINVFHPINRTNWEKQDFKGTTHILKAFKTLEEKYKGKVEFIAKGGMTAGDYEKFTDDVDIIVDQTSSYTYGMSAAYGLAKGKVVLSGMEDRARSGHYADAPIINIKPDSTAIINELEKLLADYGKIAEIAERSRAFAEQYHDSEKAAKEYLKLYL